MKVNYEQFISEVSKCVLRMRKGEDVEKIFYLFDENCGYDMHIKIARIYNVYEIIINDIIAYTTTITACKYNDINEMYKILDIIRAVNKFIK